MNVTMVTCVFGSGLHSLQASGVQQVFLLHCSYHFKDSQALVPRDRNNKHEILSLAGRVKCVNVCVCVYVHADLDSCPGLILKLNAEAILDQN